MAGIIQDQGYYERHVVPAIDNVHVTYDDPVGGKARQQMLGSARALLHLTNFNEPFGLSVVEAMACGTPVIACNRRSMPELIDHRVTGFLVNNVDEAVAAVARIGEIDRAACRAAVEARFTVDRTGIDGHVYGLPAAGGLPAIDSDAGAGGAR
jgi:glycosyltransferase involved in cell wall biosynthesis